jgi:peptidoglycan hydrolase-like protein with peptidoglycan-binding domain
MPSISEQKLLGWADPGTSGSKREAAFRDAYIKPLKVNGITVYVHVALHPIFRRLITQLDVWGANLDQRRDDWGYANRDIRGRPGQKSYHSWGIAIDLDATENPLGVRKTTFPVARVRQLCKQLGLTWGYDYEGRPDPMHFEFRGSKKQAEHIAFGLRKATPFRLPSGHVYGWKQRATKKTLARVHDGQASKVESAAVVRIQRLFGLPRDGIYGPATRKAVLAWEAKRRLPRTGCVDAARWKRMGL